MKAIILGAGNATRLYPLTKVINKLLLPLYDKPIIFHILEKIVSCNINEVILITSPKDINDFIKLLGSGEDFISKETGKQIQIVYGIQNHPKGIANGLYIAKDYIGNDSCMLYLGDNIVEDNIASDVKNFKDGAKIFLKKVKNPKYFGVATVDSKMQVKDIIEKPKNPKSNLAVIGVYLYDNTVFQKLIGQKLSTRGEYEITDINNKYRKEGTLQASMLKKAWFDIGTIDSLMEASIYMMKKKKKENKIKFKKN